MCFGICKSCEKGPPENPPAGLGLWEALFVLGHDLQPVAVRVLNEVDAHGGIFVADAAHGLMLGFGGVKVGHGEGQVEFPLAQVIGLGMIPQPGQLQTEGCAPSPR